MLYHLDNNRVPLTVYQFLEEKINIKSKQTNAEKEIKIGGSREVTVC